MDQNINNMAKNLHESHQKPIVKLNTGGVKVYIPKTDNTEKINENLNILKETLRFPRVEKRIVRTQGEFLQLERVVKVTLLHNLQNFGYRVKTGMFLHLEEALCLLETNRLEILWNNVPMSIQQAYNLFIDDKLTLNKYRTYKKLISEGFKVQKFKNTDNEPPMKKSNLNGNTSEIVEINVTDDIIGKERIEEKSDEINASPGTSDIKNESNNCTREDLNNKKREKIAEFFKKLKDKAPQNLNIKLENDPTFTCHNLKKCDNNTRYDIYLSREEMDPKIGFYEEDNTNLFAIISDDDIPFYKISRVSLPNLLQEEKKK